MNLDDDKWLDLVPWLGAIGEMSFAKVHLMIRNSKQLQLVGYIMIAIMLELRASELRASVG